MWLGMRELNCDELDLSASAANVGAKSGLRCCGEVLLLRRGTRAGDGGVSGVPRRDQGVQDLCGLAVGAHRRHRCHTDTPGLEHGRVDPLLRSAGFDIERYDDGFAFVRLGDQSVFDLDLASTMDPSGNHAGCYIVTRDADEWHRRFSSAGLSVTSMENMPWGMHEFTLTDPSGNTVRVGRNVAGTDES